MEPTRECAHDELMRKLDEIESWLDLLFSHYLQAIFLADAREAVEQADLPRQSQVSVRASRENEYWGEVPEAQGLIELLSQFDCPIEKYGVPGLLGTPTWNTVLRKLRATLRGR